VGDAGGAQQEEQAVNKEATNLALRALPSVDALLRSPPVLALLEDWPRRLVVQAIRVAIEEERHRILESRGAATADGNDEADLADGVRRALARLTAQRLVPALNATGVILHTGLGRAVLSPEAREAIANVARGYSLLEIDRRTGARGLREAGVATLLKELCGAEAATVVNNNAAACLLSLAALCAGREVIVARGQLVEIGGSFRIPEVMETSGARLHEVGATNKAHLEDYARAIGPDTAAILQVHRSNFRIVGFHEDVPLDALSRLARAHGLLLLEDLGSGNLIDLRAHGLPHEPLVMDSLRAGADVVTFSGDKLLGGPQAGLCVGREEPVARMRRHPLFRALRPDKLALAALEATLALYREEDPHVRVTTLAMLTAPAASLDGRAQKVRDAIASAPGLAVEVVRSEAAAGSGALPAIPVESRAVALTHADLAPDRLATLLRTGTPPVFSRIVDDRVLLDLRTIQPHEDDDLVVAIRGALTQTGPDPDSAS
jgi:L-seryl-tRNA(Ser) seleniumtransferase